MTEPGETLRPTLEDPAIKEAFGFCQSIMDAAKQMEGSLGDPKEVEKIINFVSALVEVSMYEHRYELRVSFPAKEEVHQEEGDQTVDNRPEPFVATAFRGLDENGAQFYNRNTFKWLLTEDVDFTERFNFNVEPSFEDITPANA